MRSIGWTASQKRSQRIGDVLAYLVLSALGLTFAVPFLWMVSTSLKSLSDAYAYPPHFVPQVIHWENYLRAWQATDPFHERRAQLVQPRMGELHLGFDARRPNHLEAGRTAHKALEKRRLSDPRLAAENKHPTLSRPHG